MDTTLDQLVDLVARLQSRVDQLESQLALALPAGAPAPRTDAAGSDRLVVAADPAPIDDGDPGPALGNVTVAGEAPTDRRQVLARVATLTAGAVAGGTALALGQATPAAAVAGVFDGNPAVLATPTTLAGVGVQATAQNGFALSGSATGSGNGVRGYHSGSGVAVVGDAPAGTGVAGYSTNGEGVRAVGEHALVAAGYGVSLRAILNNPDAVHLRLQVQASTPPPPSSTVPREAGDIIFDANENLWLCIAGGIPGTWRRLGGASSSGAFSAMATPKRVYDSRPGNLPNVGTKSPLVANTARSCDLKANGSGIPAGSTAVLVSVVATSTTGAAGGFLSIYRNGIAWPGTSNLNWSGPNQNVAVTTITAVDDLAVCNLYASQSTHVVVDVLGFYR